MGVLILRTVVSPENSHNLSCSLRFVWLIFFVSNLCLHKYIVFICEITEIHLMQLFMQVLRMIYKMLLSAVIMFTLFHASARCFCVVVTGTAEQVPCNTRKKGWKGETFQCLYLSYQSWMSQISFSFVPLMSSSTALTVWEKLDLWIQEKLKFCSNTIDER